MNLNTFMSLFSNRHVVNKNSSSRATRSRYITEKYNERSIVNRYFK
ncbi:hypothetical protein CLV86_2233 [Lacinutrix venerupis]|nr:hypothetical protein CLV86_2233 [Lacinutrix venerupis]